MIMESQTAEITQTPAPMAAMLMECGFVIRFWSNDQSSGTRELRYKTAGGYSVNRERRPALDAMMG